MKILIELPEDMYDDIEDGYICQEYADDIISIVKNGTPIPDNATNGDVLMMMFPPSEYMNDDWWNAPYQKRRANDNT